MNPVSELSFFVLLAKIGSLAGAARELNLTPSAVTKRLANLEERLGVRLLNRTTRKISLTAEGEVYLTHATKILAEIEEMESLISTSRETPKGLLRVNAPLGFGRSYIAPIVSEFVQLYPDVDVQLVLTDRPQGLPDEAVDVAIRFGQIPDSRLIARKIAPNRRLLCGSPKYFERYGVPKTPADLAQHNCIVLRQNDVISSTWRLIKDGVEESIKVKGNLVTNDGQIALKWALDGQGIVMRAEWDLARYIRSNQLQLILEEYETPQADIYAVYLERLNLSAKVTAFLDYLQKTFAVDSDDDKHQKSIW